MAVSGGSTGLVLKFIRLFKSLAEAHEALEIIQGILRLFGKTSSSISKNHLPHILFLFLSPHSFITVEAMGPNWARA